MKREETMQEQQQKNDYKGFSLFNDIEDVSLRNRNRGVIMANILEDNFFKGKVSAKGASLLINYVECIPQDQRKATMASFVEQANERGFKIQ